MKKLQLIKLVNWHFFDDEEIRIHNNAVIYGANASGKSTLLDAIHYVLSGGSCTLNKAASQGKSERTIRDYMKARTGTNEQEYVRNQRSIVTHIALEFFDDVLNEKVIAGVVLEINDDSPVKNHFYIIHNHGVEDQLFFGDDKKKLVRNSDDFFNNLTEREIYFDQLDQKGRNKTCRHEMTKALGNYDTYCDLLERAISFSGIGNIDDFTKRFLLSKDQVNAESLLNAANQYRDIKDKLDDTRKKVDHIKPIIDSYDGYLKAEKDYLIDQIVKLELDVEQEKEDSATASQNIRVYEEQKGDLNNQREAIMKEFIDASKDVAAIEADPTYSNIQSLENEIDRLEEQEEGYRKSYEIWLKDIQNEKALAEKIGLSSEFASYFFDKDFHSYLREIEDYRLEFEEYQDSMISRDHDLRQQLDKALNKEKLLLEQKEHLEKNEHIKPFVELLKQAIKDQAVRDGLKNGDNFFTTALYQCLEIEKSEEDWRPALEGMLGNYRFDIFVPGKYYKSAIKAFEGIGRHEKYFGSGVVSQDNIPIRLTKDKIGATAKFKYQSTMAENYVNFLFGDVQCVESVKDIKESMGRVLTKDGFFYDGTSLRHVNIGFSEEPYIGQESIRLALKNAKEELKEIRETIKELKEEKIKNVDPILSKMRETSLPVIIRSNRSNKNIFFNIDRVVKAIDEKKKELFSLKQEGNLLGIEERLVALRNRKAGFELQLNELEKKVHDIDDRSVEAKNKVARSNDIILAFLNAAKELRARLDESVRDSSFKEQKEAVKEKGKYSHVKMDEHLAATKRLLESHKYRLLGTIKDYVNQFNNDLGADIESVPAYRALYDKLSRDLDLDLAPKAAEQQAQMEKLFKENFVNSLLEKITHADAIISDVNRILRKQAFGTHKEIYEFKARESTNEKFMEISRYLNNKKKDVMTDSYLLDNMSDDERAAFEKIFELLIGQKTGESIEKLIDEYCDYRNYQDYDIEGKRASGETISYKRELKKKSGGETQTPFYVMVAAAFNADITRGYGDSSPCGVIMLDEAFNTMDENRITELLSYYNQLNTQLIIVVPEEKAPLIIDKVDTNVNLFNEDNQIYVIEKIKNVK
ncbi:MAG: AAA family ATPase [Bacilli bacterium]|nr:AAA family ATPase [Bacilli bacterium]